MVYCPILGGHLDRRLFETYVIDHLAKHADVKDGKGSTFIVYEGHKQVTGSIGHIYSSVFSLLKNIVYSECQPIIQQYHGIYVKQDPGNDKVSIPKAINDSSVTENQNEL